MSNKLFVLFALTLLSCSQESKLNKQGKVNYLIEAQQLLGMIKRPHIKLVDFRSPEAYANEHISNAVNITRKDIENGDFEYGGMMASKKQMETLLGNLGIASIDTIVVYDDNGLCNSSRLWWILQNYDFDQVRLLHGGIETWKTEGGEVNQVLPQPEAEEFILSEHPSMKYHCNMEEVQSNLKTEAILVDTRTTDEYNGERLKKGAQRAGRIPSAFHIDWAEAIHFEGDKRFKSKQELERIYRNVIPSNEAPCILYCHTGMRSAHTTFVLTQLLGYSNVKNYDGSWTEWSHFDELPLQKN